jgi:hypothetical protein
MSYEQQILALREQGKSYNEIRSELGCSKGTISYYLGENQKEKQRKRNTHSRRKINQEINKIKESSPCTDCGNYFPFYSMDFDHIKDNKINSVSRLRMLVGREEVYKEIEKCELVCANCHRGRTYHRSVGKR